MNVMLAFQDTNPSPPGGLSSVATVAATMKVILKDYGWGTVVEKRSPWFDLLTVIALHVRNQLHLCLQHFFSFKTG